MKHTLISRMEIVNLLKDCVNGVNYNDIYPFHLRLDLNYGNNEGREIISRYPLDGAIDYVENHLVAGLKLTAGKRSENTLLPPNLTVWKKYIELYRDPWSPVVEDIEQAKADFWKEAMLELMRYGLYGITLGLNLKNEL